MNRHLFTIPFFAAAVLLWASAASADRVVVLPPQGDAPQERLDHIEEQLFAAVRAAGHEPLSERGMAGAPAEPGPLPESGNELRAIAELQGAEWSVAPRVTSSGSRAYWLELRVGYAPETRLETLETEVRLSRETARLAEVLDALLRPEGVNGRAEDLAGEDEAARQAEEAAEEDEPEPQPEPVDEDGSPDEERERIKKGPLPELDEPLLPSDPRYGDGGSLHLQVGYGLRPIVKHSDRALGGMAQAIEIKVGHSFDSLPGFELRAGFDGVFGDTSGFSLYGGAVYLMTPFDVPLHLGAGAELGMHKATTGNDVAQFMARLSPVVSFRVVSDLYVEAALPELMYLSANDGALTVGGSVRVGWRF
jgi:hypothetical protein